MLLLSIAFAWPALSSQALSSYSPGKNGHSYFCDWVVTFLALLWNPEVATQRTSNRFVSFHKYFCKLIDILRFSYRFYLLTGEAKAVQEPHVWGSFARVLQRLERVSFRVFRWSELSPGIEVWVNFGQFLATRLCLWWRLSASRPLVLELAIGRTEVMSPASCKRTDELPRAMAWSPWS